MGALFQATSSAATLQGANISAQGEVLAGQAAAQAATFNAEIATTNAQILNQNATWSGQAGEAQAGISEEQTRAQVGAIKTNQAAGGIDVNTGSAADVQESAASVGMLNALTIRSNAAKTAYGYETEAASQTATAGLETSQAGYDIAGANLQSQATILSGVGSASASFGNYLMQNSLLTSGTGSGALSSGTDITASDVGGNTDGFLTGS